MSSSVRASISSSHSSVQPMWSVPRPRWLCVATGTCSKMRSISSSVKPSAASRSRELPATSCCAHGQAVMPCAATPTSRRVPRSEATRRAEERVDLLRLDAGHRRRLVLRVARRDRDLGGARVLAVAHALGDVLRERLGLEGRLAEDDLADRFVDDLLEARHVRALLLRAEVDEALDLGGEDLLRAVLSDADDLLDAGDADAREADLERGTLGLDVWCGDGGGPGARHPAQG